jgi:Flp pilus assembly pilin Flp
VGPGDVTDDRPMTNSRQTWDELGSKLSSLGLKLKLHYEQEVDGDHDEDDPGVRRSLERIGEAIEDAFEALGNAVDDDAVRSDAKESAALLVDALNATFTEVGDELRNAVRRRS